MKNLFILFSLIIVSTNCMAQFPVINEKCATNHSLNYRNLLNPSIDVNIKRAENRAADWLVHHENYFQNRNGVLRIPVVFHVVYHTSDSVNQNIHDSLIYSQLDVLNEDFRRMNLDASNTRNIFDSVAVDLGIEFCLASIDPLGNSTTGITRTLTSTSHFTSPFNQSVKADATGGKDPWPTDQYLNIWVCDMSIFNQPVVLGYAQFPGDNPLTDGVVIQYQYIGKTNYLATAPSNLGRTTTHEVGHWLGLRHIWGDGPCSADDFIWDTPNANAQSNFDCDTTKNTCDDLGNLYWGSLNPPDMIENFMDYSADDCMNMFSRGQRDRIWSFLMTDRVSLFSSNGCGIPTLFAQTEINDLTCAGNCDGEITVHPLNGTAPYSFLWNDALNQTDSIATNLCYGNYTCRIIDTNNDTIYVDVDIANPLLMYNTFDITHASCVGCFDGIIEVNTWGGVPPYSFTIDNGIPQSDSMFVYLDPGIYDITITDSCGNTHIEQIEIISTMGIEESNLDQVQIYPNPTNSILNILLPNSTNKKIRILNGLGQLLYSFESNQSLEIIQLDKLKLSKGIYWIQFENQNEIKYVRIIFNE